MGRVKSVLSAYAPGGTERDGQAYVHLWAFIQSYTEWMRSLRVTYKICVISGKVKVGYERSSVNNTSLHAVLCSSDREFT